MNELLIKAAFGLLRNAATPVIMWLNARDILTTDETLQVLLVVASLVVSGGWTIYNKVIAMRERNTAAAMPPSTPTEVKEAVKAGDSAPAISPDNVVPVIIKANVILLMVATMALAGCGMKIARITPLPAEVEMVDANITTVIANSAELVVKADRFVLPITSMEAEAVKRGDINASVDSVFDTIVGAYVKAADYAIAQMKAGVKAWPQLKALVQPVLDAGQRVIDFTNSIGAIKTRAHAWLIAFRDALANLAGEFLVARNFGGAR